MTLSNVVRDFLFDIGRVTEVDADVILLQILTLDAITCVLMLGASRATRIIWTLDSDKWRLRNNMAIQILLKI